MRNQSKRWARLGVILGLCGALWVPAVGAAADGLKPYPKVGKGDRTPFDIWRYAGRGPSSFENPVLPMTFSKWLRYNLDRKESLMKEVRAYMDGRYDFSGKTLPGVKMSGGKPIMAGPVSRVPEKMSFEALAKLSPEEIKQKDLFPYKPLAHPIHTTAHMVFPEAWLEVHPEDRRIDVDMDIPQAYLPEFPPPLYLTTHKELGDVTGGKEITFDNYFAIFDGLLTPEQMEGLKELFVQRLQPGLTRRHTASRNNPAEGLRAWPATSMDTPMAPSSLRPIHVQIWRASASRPRACGAITI